MHKVMSKALGMAALMGAGIGGYMLLMKKNPDIMEDMKDMARDTKNKATDFMNDMKN